MATRPIAVRLDDETIARLDALVPEFSTKARDAGRSEIMRTLILTTIESIERELGIQPPGRGARRRRRPDREG